MILTRQRHVSWVWAGVTYLPWAATIFASSANTVLFALELRKFTANPAAIASLMTWVGAVSLFGSPLVAWWSDRVWTRWGRRKVFYVPAVVAQAGLLLLVPWAPNLVCLFGLYVLLHLAIACKTPYELLVQEVVPSHQRGRAAVMQKIYVQGGLVAYNLALIGRFDDLVTRHSWEGWVETLSGEVMVFGLLALALAGAGLWVGLGIVETRPEEGVGEKVEAGAEGRRTAPWAWGLQFWRDVARPEWWPMYLLALVQMLYGVKLGGMVALLFTEQWGYSTQVLGLVQGVGQVASVGLVMVFFPLVDRHDKLKLLGLFLSLSVAGKLAWYGYVRGVLGNGRPEIWELLVFGEGLGLIGNLAAVVAGPLVFEFIPLRKLGTMVAGLGLFRGVLGLAFGPMVGVWLWAWSAIFLAGPGEEVSVALREAVEAKEVQAWSRAWGEESGRKFWIRAENGAPRGTHWRVRRESKEKASRGGDEALGRFLERKLGERLETVPGRAGREAVWKPREVDYFSAYLLMAGSELLALGLVVHLGHRERQGKVRRWGKIEDEAARAGAHGGGGAS